MFGREFRNFRKQPSRVAERGVERSDWVRNAAQSRILSNLLFEIIKCEAAVFPKRGTIIRFRPAFAQLDSTP
jgi:hypothetical protein